MKRKYIILLFLLLYCQEDYKKERTRWAMQYRNQIQEDFQGYSSIEELIQFFLSDLNQNKDLQKYFLTEEEYKKVYWANEEWDKIYDKGMTLENLTILYYIYIEKNTKKWSEKIKKNLKLISYELKETKPLGSSKIYYLNQIRVKERDQIYELQIIKRIIEHNQKFKILSLYEP